MIEKLNINGFKCFDSSEVILRNLNIFSGVNSSGKSSAIQAFLLLCNIAERNTPSLLNGMWLRLGTFDECRNHITNSRKIILSVSDTLRSFSIELQSENDDDVNVNVLNESAEIRELLRLQNQHVYYLPANRIGPEDHYQKNFDRTNFLGNKAEFAIDFLYKNRKKEVSPFLAIDKESITLEYQVNYWMEKLFSIKNFVRDLGLSNTLSVEYSLRNSKPVRPYHMGSGISYAISVLISCLSAAPEDIIIIENPEIHLHPKAQSELTEFLCFVANSGVQVILETHSDHVFNGVRKSIVKKGINHERVAVQFFCLDENSIARNTVIEINEHGRILNPKKQLFDQFDEDLDQILGL